MGLGTYGGHLELSAFAHMTKRNVKVVQPGLVYVIEWDAGGEDEPEEEKAQTQPTVAGEEDDTHTLKRRERKRLEREKASTLPPIPQPSEAYAANPVYVA